MKAITDERGTATTEFALVGVLFLFMIAIAVQGALIFNRWLIITDISEQAARYGAPCYGRSVQSCSTTDIQNYVANATANLVQQGELTVNVSSSGGLLTVTTTCAVPRVSPFVEALLPNPTTVTATASMRLENGGP